MGDDAQVIEEEIEVLESIFGQGDVSRHGKVWGFPRICITVVPHLSLGRDALDAQLEVTYAAGYPRVAPGIKIAKWRGISEDAGKRLEDRLKKEAKRLIGDDPFVYDLTRSVQEFLVANRVTTKSFYDEYAEKQTRTTKEEQAAQKALEQAKLVKDATIHARVNRALREPNSPAAGPSKPSAWQVPKELLLASDDEEENGRGQESQLERSQLHLDGLLKAGRNSRSRYMNDFEEVKVLGTGGFGKVVKARNRLDGRLYAVKRIKLEKRDVESNRKTLREVTSLAKMFHKHIVRYYQAWIEESFSAEDSGDESSDDGSSEFSNSYSFDVHLPGSGADFESSDFPNVGEFGDWSDDEVREKNSLASRKKARGSSSSDSSSNSSSSGSDGSSDSDESQRTSRSLSQKSTNGGTFTSRGHILFIQMEFCPGRTLREIIDQKVLVKNPELVGKMLREIVEALWYVHDKCHFIHRDLKPANVFLDESGNVKLGDFGLAVTVDDKKEKNIERADSPAEELGKGGASSAPLSASSPRSRAKRAGKVAEAAFTAVASPPRSPGKGKKKQKQAVKQGALLEANASLLDENTSGVGTTLYRAPEVVTGKYDEKCDMWSLGVMLFEMLVPPFETGMERIRTLMALRESGKVSAEWASKLSASWREMIESLLRKSPRKRPSAQRLLESGKLPRAIETEQSAFEEVMRVVNSSGRDAPLYTQLMETFFSQKTRPEALYTYDADVLKYSNLSRGKGRGDSALGPDTVNNGVGDAQRHMEALHIMQCAVTRELERQFTVFGAVPFSGPLLMPIAERDRLHSDQLCQLMDPQGTVAVLPVNLTRPFARWVALSGSSWMKRFDFSRVYLSSETGNSLMGGQPRYKLQGSLDIIAPAQLLSSSPAFSHAWHTDVLRCSVLALVRCTNHHFIGSVIPGANNAASLIGKQDVTVFVQDCKIQEALVRALELGESREAATKELALLDSLFSNERMQWPGVRKKCLEVLSQKQTDALRSVFAHRGNQVQLVESLVELCHNNMESGDGKQFLDAASGLMKHLVSVQDVNCVFRPWLTPIPDMNCGLYYAIAMKRRSTTRGAIAKGRAAKKGASSGTGISNSDRGEDKNSGSNPSVCASFRNAQAFVAATGGRFDQLVQDYKLQSRGGASVAAIGTRFHVERIALQLTSPQEAYSSKTCVLVAAPSDQEMATIDECSELVTYLRENDISADFCHPFGGDHATAPISDRFIAYCKANGIAWLVNKRKGQIFRVRGVFSTQVDREFVAQDLVTFINNRNNSHS